MDLTNEEIASILKDLQSKKFNRADIMLEFFEITDINENLLPPDIKGHEAQLKKILMTGAAQGFI